DWSSDVCSSDLHAHLLSRADAAHGVGHVQTGALLAHDDRPNVSLRSSLDDRVHRVANQELNTFALEDLGNSGRSFHNPSAYRARPLRSRRGTPPSTCW